MRPHDLGPRTDTDYPPATNTRFERDYGRRSAVALERPFIDDHPAPRDGCEARSRWGSRPPREVEMSPPRGGLTPTGLFRIAWTRIRNAVRGKA